MKHFIPHHAITCVVQGEKPNQDVVSCILLIYNPATSCPVHVHASGGHADLLSMGTRTSTKLNDRR